MFSTTFYIVVEKPGFPKHSGLMGLVRDVKGAPPCLVHSGDRDSGASGESSDFGEVGSLDPVNTSEQSWG